MMDAKPREVDMDELRKGVEKVIAFGKPPTPQSTASQKKARHRSIVKRRPVKTPSG